MIFKISILIGLSCAILIMVIRRHTKLNLLDILVISTVLSLGIYPISDVLNSSYNFDSSIFILSIGYLFLSVGILYFLFVLFGSYKDKKNFSLVTCIQQAQSIPQKIVILSFVTATVAVLYFFYRYDLIFRVENDEISFVNTYRQVIQNVVFPLFNLVTIAAYSKIIGTGLRGNKINLILLFFVTAYWLFFGRREFIFQILILGFLWYVSHHNFLKFKTILYSSTLLVTMILGANAYQNLRAEIMLYSINGEFNTNKSLKEILFDFESSEQNLKDRPSALPLFSKILNEIDSNEKYSNGEILEASVLNVVPSIFFGNKKYINDDEIVARQLRIRDDDFSTNLFSSFYVDFGWIGLLLQPFFMLLYFLFSGKILSHLKSAPFFFILIFTEVLNSTLNIEIGVSGILSSVRLTLIFLFLHFLFKKSNQTIPIHN